MKTSDPFAESIRSRGYRLTPQRRAILRILAATPRHLTPLEVFERAQEVMPGITEPTVYRTLTFLAKQGLILPAHMGNGQFAYEYTARNHHHLICRSCSHMIDIPEESLQGFFKAFQEQTGYQIEFTHLTFFGLCPECQEAHQPGESKK